jgi:hypothetical protein
VAAHQQISPHLQRCCLLLCANESYARAAEDLYFLTGMESSGSTLHRLVQDNPIGAPEVMQRVEEANLDGGKVRLRTPKGEPCVWRDYKAVTLPQIASYACFEEPNKLLDWMNHLPLTPIVTCIGDGHPGIWKLFAQFTVPEQRREILDWYHLMENLDKVGGSLKRLQRVKEHLWVGHVDLAIQEFQECRRSQALNFVEYLKQHRTRLPNYAKTQQNEISIGSGAVESAIKQIGRRIKLSGAQWNSANVATILSLRCAYLNGYFSIPHKHNYSSQ